MKNADYTMNKILLILSFYIFIFLFHKKQFVISDAFKPT